MLNTAQAGEVSILAADFRNTGENRWSVSVTLEHDDTGWYHYADEWRVVNAKGKVLGERVLYHPHIGEQPFTRSLDNVGIPQTDSLVYIEAHDKVHGWSPQRLSIDLTTAREGHVRVEAR